MAALLRDLHAPARGRGHRRGRQGSGARPLRVLQEARLRYPRERPRRRPETGLNVPADKDVLGKADALLRRGTPIGSTTGAVPVLTELIEAPAPPDLPGELARE